MQLETLLYSIALFLKVTGKGPFTCGITLDSLILKV